MKRRDSKVALTLAVCLLVAAAIGLILDRFRTVTDVVSGEAEDVDLLITEICSKNTAVIEDGTGKYSDYIEIYNRGEACNLRGFTVTDGKNTSEPLGDLPLGAGEYTVIFVGRELTGFSLSANGGETVFLKNIDGTTAAQVTTVPMTENQVMLWNGAGYELSMQATPGFPNTDEGYQMFTVGAPDEDPSVVISELLLANRSTLPDQNGNFSDVIELYNKSDKEISLSGYHLSDSFENRFRFALPSVTLPAGGYVVIFCDSTGSSADGEIHANFGLAVGETLVLTSPVGKYVSAEIPDTADDRSLSLVDGAYVDSAVSLGFANTAEGETAFTESRFDPDAALVISEVLLSGDGTPYGGRFCDVVEITNRSDASVSTVGWYLTDNADPFRCALPEKTLAPGECMVIVCDGESGDGKAGFALSTGETLCLTTPFYKRGEAVVIASAGEGLSLLREESEDGAVYRAGDVSVGFANTDDGRTKYLATTVPTGLRISEVISSNTQTLRGSYGTCCDWVELYNASSEPISLADWYLSDDPDELRKGALPNETIAPGEYYVVFLSKSAENLLAGYPVMPFALSASGDCLYLSKGDSVADSVLIPLLATDTSYGRPAGSDFFAVLESVTPHAENTSAAVQSAIPTAQTAQGVYEGISSLDVVLSGEGTIYYTTDCTVPTTASPVFSGSVTLTKTTVIRAVCVENGKAASEILDLTYIINEGHTLPVASLVTTPENLWDHYTGIYVEGPNPGTEFPYATANFWQQWEKEATVSLFETDGGGFTSPCGIRIFGAYSRALAQKSFSCFFRNAYGASSLNYPLYGEEGLSSYEAFIFRNTGQDFTKARMRDALLTELAADAMYMPVQKNRPVILYLNGEYWGLYYIREKINENYIAGNFNVTEEEVDLSRANGTSSEAYLALRQYCRENDLSDPDAYAYVASQMDIDQYIDYIIAQIYICNTDNGNIKFFKVEGGKWTWIMYDVDQSFRSAYFDTVAEHLNPAGTGSMNRFSTAVICGLLENDGFRDQFLRRFAWQMETVWNADRVNAYIDKYYAAIQPEMQRDCARWEHTYSDWEAHVESLRTFAETRAAYVYDHVKAYFDLTDAQMQEYGFSV